MAYASDLPDFPDLLRATGDAVNLPLWIVEKDYYVTRALRALQDNIGEQFLFKGGTSLSKGWNLIERFSEDIDLLFFTEHDGKTLSTSDRHRRFKQAEKIVAKTPGFTSVKPNGPLNSETGMHRDSFFAYTMTQTPTGPVSDKIKLEMNCRGGTHPHEPRQIRSFIAAFAESQGESALADDLLPFDVECLGVTRTFMEKLFAAYAAFVADRALRRARHYYDLYHLAGLAEVRAFIVSTDFATIFADVRTFSTTYWPEKAVPPGMSFAQYDVLRPTGEHLAELIRNYDAERILFFREPPSMTEILERLQNLPFPH
jgi:predicted nucleotidyltransferase component of viral defense system